MIYLGRPAVYLHQDPRHPAGRPSIVDVPSSALNRWKPCHAWPIISPPFLCSTHHLWKSQVSTGLTRTCLSCCRFVAKLDLGSEPRPAIQRYLYFNILKLFLRSPLLKSSRKKDGLEIKKKEMDFEFFRSFPFLVIIFLVFHNFFFLFLFSFFFHVSIFLFFPVFFFSFCFFLFFFSLRFFISVYPLLSASHLTEICMVIPRFDPSGMNITITKKYLFGTSINLYYLYSKCKTKALKSGYNKRRPPLSSEGLQNLHLMYYFLCPIS